MKQNTKLLHGYTVLDQYTGAASIPIYQTSTFHNTELYCDEQKYLYTRFSNPTIDALEDGLRCIENAKYALSFSSGMSAISNVKCWRTCHPSKGSVWWYLSICDEDSTALSNFS